jgi:hypothetical protein
MDIAELRRLADVYGVPPDMLGLTSSPDRATADSLTGDQEERMRRRDLLAAAAGIAGAGLLPLDRAHAATSTVADALFGRFVADPVPPAQLAASLGAARADFAAVRYHQLVRRLPQLIATATATRDHATGEQVGPASSQLAAVYILATEVLVKLHENPMAWATADRAITASRSGRDPLTAAEAARVAAVVMRRTAHPDAAGRAVTEAARQLRADTNLDSTAAAGMYVRMLATASYTAALRDDRSEADTLLDEATATAGKDPALSLHLDMYRIGIARALGDYGTAVDCARRINPARLTAPERRARYWEDTALALHGRGRPKAAFAALQTVEREAPQEVRFRPWAQQLTRDLIASDSRLSGLRSFAGRIGALA